jgi:arginine decarboxylase
MNRNSQKLLQKQAVSQKKLLLVGNRIPKDFFITSGVGESDITIHAGSYHLALKDAGIEKCNIVTYSSILPAIATEIKKPDNLIHGSVLETIMACSHAKKGQMATAGLIFGWLYDRVTGKKYGGIVCEYSGNESEEEAVKSLKASLDELYKNGFSENYEIKDIKIIKRSFIPNKKFGTVIVALCFVNYIYPISEYS